MNVEKLRLFLAVPLRELFLNEIHDSISSLKPRVQSVKWCDAAQVHVTLHFFGDTPASDVEQIDGVMKDLALAFPPLSICLNGIGAFPDLRRPRVVWIGVEEKAGTLSGLQLSVQRELQRLGYEVERREFKPHATLGRVKLPGHGDALDHAIKTVKVRFPTPVKVINHFVLYQSLLQPEGARYEILRTYPLAKPA